MREFTTVDYKNISNGRLIVRYTMQGKGCECIHEA